MLSDRQQTDADDDGSSSAPAPAVELALPDSVQAVIAARLDTLKPHAKTALQAAAVVGHIFWSGAVAALTGYDDADVRRLLHDLARREYLRPSRAPTFAGEAEYTFAHALIRDVAYAQIPRADRAARHAAAADWLATTVADNPGDYAAAIAGHFDQALALAESAGSIAVVDADGLAEQSRRWHAAAADLALPIDLDAAIGHLRDALRVAADRSADRPPLLTRLGDALTAAGRNAEAAEAFLAAEDLYRDVGDAVGAAASMTRRAGSLWAVGRGGDAAGLLDRGIAALEVAGAGMELADAYARRAVLSSAAGRFVDAVHLADKALALADVLDPSIDRARTVVRAFRARGSARASLGGDGDVDMQRALALALEHDLTDAAVTLYHTAAGMHRAESVAESLADIEEAIGLAVRRGRQAAASGLMSMGRALNLQVIGRLDEALEVWRAASGALEALGASRDLTLARLGSAGVLADLGRVDEAEAVLDEPRTAADEDDPDQLEVQLTELRIRHVCAVARGDRDLQRRIGERLTELVGPELAAYLAEDDDLPLFADILIAAGMAVRQAGTATPRAS